MEGYKVWTFHGENENDNVSMITFVQNEGIPNMDEMFDVLDNIIGDDAEVDASTTEAFTVQYDKLFDALNSELYPRILHFFYP